MIWLIFIFINYLLLCFFQYFYGIIKCDRSNIWVIQSSYSRGFDLRLNSGSSKSILSSNLCLDSRSAKRSLSGDSVSSYFSLNPWPTKGGLSCSSISSNLSLYPWSTKSIVGSNSISLNLSSNSRSVKGSFSCSSWSS